MRSYFSTQVVLWTISCLLIAGCNASGLQKGKELVAKRAYSSAIEVLTNVIRDNPQNAEAHFFRGASYSAIKEWDKAIEDYSIAIELDPHYVEAYWSRGYCYANKRMDEKAIDDYTQSLALGTQFSARVYSLRAGAYFRSSMLDKAEQDLLSVLQLKPGDEEATQGLEDIRKAKLDPTFTPSALRYRSIAEQPQYGEALLDPEVTRANDQFIREIIQANGTKEKALQETLTIAWSSYNRGDYVTAMKRFNQAWLLGKDNAEIFRGYSLILQKWGYETEARVWQQKAEMLISKDPLL